MQTGRGQHKRAPQVRVEAQPGAGAHSLRTPWAPPLLQAWAAGAVCRQVRKVSVPGIRQRDRRHGVDRSSETLGQHFGHVVAGLVSRMQDGMSGHHAGARQVS